MPIELSLTHTEKWNTSQFKWVIHRACKKNTFGKRHEADMVTVDRLKKQEEDNTT